MAVAVFSSTRSTVDLAMDPLITCRLCLSEFHIQDMYELKDCKCLYCISVSLLDCLSCSLMILVLLVQGIGPLSEAGGASVERKSKWIKFYNWQLRSGSLNAFLIHKLSCKSHVVSLYTAPDSFDKQLCPVPTLLRLVNCLGFSVS